MKYLANPFPKVEKHNLTTKSMPFMHAHFAEFWMNMIPKSVAWKMKTKPLCSQLGKSPVSKTIKHVSLL
jgi:hypothetical protein